jgi:hypothetical protein
MITLSGMLKRVNHAIKLRVRAYAGCTVSLHML